MAMSIAADNSTDLIRQYIERGYKPIPYNQGDKGPFKRGWQTAETPAPIAFKHKNVGLLLGPNGGRLCDVDLDCIEAVYLAEHFLPATNMISGRPSRPRSHWWYTINGSLEYAKLSDPRPQTIRSSATLAELRWGFDGSAHQTMVPPSIHPSKEQVRWDIFEDPTEVSGQDIMRCVKRLAAAALLTRIWYQSSGQRNNICMALSGALFRARWQGENIVEFIRLISTYAGDDEVPKRIETVKATIRNSETRPTTGLPELMRLLGNEAGYVLRDWLNLSRSTLNVQRMEAEEAFTDLGNAKRLVNKFGSDLAYVSDWRGWFIWNYKIWKKDTTGEIHRRCNAIAEDLYSKATEGDPDDNGDGDGYGNSNSTSPARKFALKSQSHQRLLAMAQRAATLDVVAHDTGDFDRDNWLLTIANGTINLKSGELQPHRREDYITKISPATYDPTKECPHWLEFLDRITAGSQEIQRYLQKAVGYTLTGWTSERCVFILYGTGANGKSVFVQTIANLLGDLAVRATPETLLHKVGGGSATSDIARLAGSRMVQAAEVEQNRFLAQALIKDITGGEKISARFLYQESFEFTPAFKIWLSTNYRPQVSGSDTAIWDRIRLIPFEVTIPENERIPMSDMLETHAMESSGILNWALEGCALWRRERLRPPAPVNEATKEYRAEMDIVGAWIQERTKETPKPTRFSNLYDDYRAWCEQLGEYAGSARALGEELTRHGYTKYRAGGGIVYRNISLIE